MDCERCGHPTERHCKGGVQHVSQYKGASVNEVKRICVGRHCLNPLCSCVDFVEPNTSFAEALRVKTAEVEAQVAEWKYRTPQEVQAMAKAEGMVLVYPPEVRETAAENAAWLGAIADDRRNKVLI
jgi:hypothetical protein